MTGECVFDALGLRPNMDDFSGFVAIEACAEQVGKHEVVMTDPRRFGERRHAAGVEFAPLFDIGPESFDFRCIHPQHVRQDNDPVVLQIVQLPARDDTERQMRLLQLAACAPHGRKMRELGGASDSRADERRTVLGKGHFRVAAEIDGDIFDRSATQEFVIGLCTPVDLSHPAEGFGIGRAVRIDRNDREER